MVRAKLCKKCGNIYPEIKEYFYTNRKYFLSHCKLCCRKHAKDHYYKNSDRNTRVILKRINKMLLPLGLKKCSKCNKILPIENFSFLTSYNCHTSRCSKCLANNSRENARILVDSYITNSSFNVHVNEVSPELIEAKRQQIKLHRIIKNSNK